MSADPNEKRSAAGERQLDEKSRALAQANDRFRAMQSQLLQLYQNLPSPVLRVAGNGEIQEANAAARELLGYDDAALKGKHVGTISTFAARAVRQPAGQTPTAQREESWVAANSDKIPVMVSETRIEDAAGKLQSMIFIGNDLRAKKQRDAEQRHAQKLESIGQLTAGVAHEINTPMQFIGDNVNFLQEAFNDLMTLVGVYEKIEQSGFSATPPQLEELREIRDRADLEYLRERAPRAFETTLQGVSRVTKIVSAMKTFSHPRETMVMMNLNKAAETTLTVTKGETKYVAEVVLEAGDIPVVVCNGSDISQVLVNLVVNAAHAIAEKRGGENGPLGTITIKTMQDAEHVVLSVTDSGNGIPEKIRHRIFDPFFTTKKAGLGTGQGLAISYKIVVEKHAGTLTFETELGKGTTFFVRLPIMGPSDSRGQPT